MQKKYNKICWSNSSNAQEADIILFGIPNEKGSHALRKGSSKAPDVIRRISHQLDVYYHKKTKSVAYPMGEMVKRRVFDYGNVTKSQIPEVLQSLPSTKLPIIIGGDHSNTFPVIKTISKKMGPVSLVFLDAHPDLIGSRGSYYGSTVFDCLPYIDAKSSFLVGTRSPELEELENIKKHKIQVFSPLDIAKIGIVEATKIILEKAKGNVYVSLDMDCIDPAYAPGVSVPVPMGIQSLEAMYLIGELAKRGILGFDVVEVCPPHDINDITSHLASRMIGQVIASCKI